MWLGLVALTSAFAEKPPADVRDLYKVLKKIPHGGQSDWDAAVKDRLVARYDADRSGMVDTAAELDAVHCSIWTLLDAKITKGRGGAASLRVTYVNPPWLTHLMGVDQAVEQEMFAVLARCSLP